VLKKKEKKKPKVPNPPQTLSPLFLFGPIQPLLSLSFFKARSHSRPLGPNLQLPAQTPPAGPTSLLSPSLSHSPTGGAHLSGVSPTSSRPTPPGSRLLPGLSRRHSPLPRRFPYLRECALNALAPPPLPSPSRNRPSTGSTTIDGGHRRNPFPPP
jgi:hypothetical protein